MSESATFKVFRAASLREQIILAGNFAKSLLDAGLMIQIIVKVLAKSRTGEQNDTLHGLCSNCADQLLWVGRKLDTEGWKRLMVDAWARATDQKAGDIVPSLDGLSVVTLNRSTAKMKSAELAELIEFVLAEGTTRGVKFKYLAKLCGEPTPNEKTVRGYCASSGIEIELNRDDPPVSFFPEE